MRLAALPRRGSTYAGVTTSPSPCPLWGGERDVVTERPTLPKKCVGHRIDDPGEEASALRGQERSLTRGGHSHAPTPRAGRVQQALAPLLPGLAGAQAESAGGSPGSGCGITRSHSLERGLVACDRQLQGSVCRSCTALGASGKGTRCGAPGLEVPLLSGDPVLLAERGWMRRPEAPPPPASTATPTESEIEPLNGKPSRTFLCKD